MSIKMGDLTLFDVQEISERFSMHPITVRRYFRTGKLKGRKIGRRWFITEEALREYFKQGTEAGKRQTEEKAV